MRLRTGSSLCKTLSFAVIHLAIAVTLGWLFTGGFILGSLLALVEPTANTFVSHGLEKLAGRWRGDARRRAIVKSSLLTVSHFAVAVSVGYLLSGSWVVAGAYAVVEPLANGVAHFFFERWWERGAAGAPAVAGA
jgi:uncharacterized membrane protein